MVKVHLIITNFLWLYIFCSQYVICFLSIVYSVCILFCMNYILYALFYLQRTYQPVTREVLLRMFGQPLAPTMTSHTQKTSPPQRLTTSLTTNQNMMLRISSLLGQRLCVNPCQVRSDVLSQENTSLLCLFNIFIK